MDKEPRKEDTGRMVGVEDQGMLLLPFKGKFRTCKGRGGRVNSSTGEASGC